MGGGCLTLCAIQTTEHRPQSPAGTTTKQLLYHRQHAHAEFKGSAAPGGCLAMVQPCIWTLRVGLATARQHMCVRVRRLRSLGTFAEPAPDPEAKEPAPAEPWAVSPKIADYCYLARFNTLHHRSQPRMYTGCCTLPQLSAALGSHSVAAYHKPCALFAKTRERVVPSSLDFGPVTIVSRFERRRGPSMDAT